MVSGIIMASGLSVRMGNCKLLMDYKNKPMIQWVMEAVKESSLSPKLVVTGNEEIKELAQRVNLTVVINEKGNLGQSQSIKLGVLNSEEADGYAFIPGDQPFISSSFINVLIQEFEKAQDKIIVPVFQGTRGNPVIFPKTFREELLNLQGDVGGRVLLKKYKEYIQFVDIEEGKLLLDIDTKEEYERLINGN
ncbi:MAG: molybdenum cofactor cytidylyltransferase [Clostridium sp.]